MSTPSELQLILREFGLADRTVRHAISADTVHVWNDDHVGLSLLFYRDQEAYLQLATKNGEAYALYRCCLAQVSPQLLHSSIEALQRGQYKERKDVEVRIGNGTNALHLNAEG